MLFAAGWLQRAETRLGTPDYDNRYLNFARDLTQKINAKKRRAAWASSSGKSSAGGRTIFPATTSTAR
jgi:hypothetical protein